MTWTPPAAARRAAALALEVRATLPRSQRAGTPIGIARAVQLRDGRPISLDTARRMLAFFTRSARFETAARPSKAWQAWHLWGGTPARDALRMDPMICAPCVNPRDAQKYVRGMLDDLCRRANPPRSMPRTAEGARLMLAQAYDDAIGRARAGAFKRDKARTAAALEDAARYAYGLGMYGPAPVVPYDLLDRMRPPADPRQPDLFARANPAPPTLDDLRAVAVRGNRVLTYGAQRNAIAEWLKAEGYRVTHDPHYTGSTYWIDDHNVDHTLQTSDDGDAILHMADEFGPKRKIKGIATAAGLLAVARKFVRANPAGFDADAARLGARRTIEEAYIGGVRTFRHRADDRTLTFSQPPNRGRNRVIIATYDAEDRALGRPSEHAEMSRSQAFDRAVERGFWLPVAAYEVPPPAPIAAPEVTATDLEIARLRQAIARVEEDRDRFKNQGKIRSMVDANVMIRSLTEQLRAAENRALATEHARASKPARTPTPPPIAEDERDPARLSAGMLAAQEAAAYYRQEAASADADDNPTRADLARADAETYEAEAQDLARRLAAATPAPAPVPPLVALGAQVEAAAARADAAAIAADAVKGKRLRRAARAAADAAADEYADALRARDALSARMGDEWIEAARARGRAKKPAPAPAPAPSKPAAPLRPVTGKAREVLARLGASVVSLGDVARVGCTDDPGARRIMAALTRSGAAMPAGPGAWSLDPSRLDECPPARPRTREPRPVCVGECGRWTPARGPSRPWLAALGPTSTIYDSEGRGYPIRWALARLDALGDGWHASNVGGRADPKYDRELQARERGSTASRAQVEKIAASLSLAQWVAPSSTPADSAPVVWIDPAAEGHVVSGNGRTAAYALARPPRLAVAETVGGRWKIPKTLRAALEAVDLVPIRIMGEAGEIDRAAAVLLAGASQASASGSLTQTERALSVVRALGLSVADMPALDWPEALSVSRLVAFGAANRTWASWALARLAPERAILLSSDPLALAVHYRDVMIGLLPPEAREGGIGGLSIDRALLGALPGIWTLETRIRDGRAPQSWSLVAVLPEARRWASRSAGRLKEIAADAASDARQEGLFGPARLDPEGAGLLAVALGGALARASGRMDPEAAGAEMVAALLDAAPDPSQPSLLGIDDADPVTVLARRARLSLGRSNPPGRDLARLSDAARRWHWGRYKQAKSARVDRAAWQPSQGFALGELAAISLGADRLEVPPGHLLCATDEGDEADLFVVPPLPLGSLAPRPLRAIEYLADKAGDGPSWYVHDFDPAYPQATTKGGALAIIRKGSRFSIDPARGIVG